MERTLFPWKPSNDKETSSNCYSAQDLTKTILYETYEKGANIIFFRNYRFFKKDSRTEFSPRLFVYECRISTIVHKWDLNFLF